MPPPPDSSAIDAAIVAALLADAALSALMPDGVFVDEASPGAQRFVIVSLLSSLDVATFGGRAIEDARYQEMLRRERESAESV